MNGVDAPFILLLEPNVGFQRLLQSGLSISVSRTYIQLITRYRCVARRVCLDFEICDLCRFQGLSFRRLSPLLPVIGQGRAFVVEDENGILGVVAEVFRQLVCAVGVIPDLLQARDLPLNGTRIGRGAGGR